MEILPQLLVNALIAGSIYALASSGLALTYHVLRALNFAHGHVMMLGVYVFYSFHVMSELPIYSSLLCTLLVLLLVSAIVLRIFLLPFLRYSFLLSLVSTIALSTMLESIISMTYGVQVKSLPLESYATSFEIGGVFITPLQVIIIASALTLLPLLAFIIHGTSLGRATRALAEDRYAAESFGISYKKISYAIFFISVLLAGYAGVLVGYETNMQPTMGTSYTIKAFAAMTLGGLGNLWGTIAGSYLLGLIENLGIGLEFNGTSIPAGYKDAFAFFVILLVLLFKPSGLFNKSSRKT